MNPDIIDMLGDALSRGFSVLVLTNAMQPMLRPRIRDGLLALRDAHGDRLTMRVSLDHYTRAAREERGPRLVRQDDRGHRLAGARRLHAGACRADLLGRERGGRARRLCRADRRARLAGRCLRSRRSSSCSPRWTRAPTCRRSPKAAGASWAKTRTR